MPHNLEHMSRKGIEMSKTPIKQCTYLQQPQPLQSPLTINM